MLSIRRLTEDDLELIRPIADASLAGEEAVLRISRTGFSLSYVPLSRAEWRTFPPDEYADPMIVVNDDRSALFAAFEDDTFIGMASVRTNPTGWADVMDIRVDASHRRKSVARNLLDACERFADARKMHGLRIASTDTNPALCQFCGHCGFALAGVDTRALHYTDSEREKPMAMRAALLFFYRPIQKG